MPTLLCRGAARHSDNTEIRECHAVQNFIGQTSAKQSFLSFQRFVYADLRRNDSHGRFVPNDLREKRKTASRQSL